MPSLPPDLREAAVHVDHDMSLFLGLHEELNACRFRAYPEAVRRGLHVAYATLFRTLMEFFHGGRPKKPAHRDDLTCMQYLQRSAEAEGDPFDGWAEKKAERERLDDADKLAAHLSRLRGRKTGPDWGDERDLAIIEPKVQRLFEGLGPEASEVFPQTRRALHCLHGRTHMPWLRITAYIIGMLLAAILTISVALRLRYKPTGTEQDGRVVSYIDTWTGDVTYCALRSRDAGDRYVVECWR